jgi:hypothetical protein
MILKIPGATPQDSTGKYDFLDNESIVSKLLEFQENSTAIISLYSTYSLQLVYLDSGKSTASSGRNKHFTGNFQKKGSESPSIQKLFLSKRLFIY